MRARQAAPEAITAALKSENLPRAFRPPAGLPLAIDPRAFGFLFEEPTRTDAYEIRNGVAVVQVVGPLMHHEEWWFDSYDAIKGRVAAALQSEAHCVLLSIDSPGGLVSGCFDTVRELRAMAEAAGKPLYSYADGQSTSAGYALACAGERIYCPETGIVGSIGVIDVLVDQTAADAQMGARFTLVASGEKKIHGQPHAPVTDEAVASVTEMVDALAQRFFALVAERRSSLSAEQIQSLQAGLFVGEQALGVGLVDEIATLDQAIQRLSESANTESAGIGAGHGGGAPEAKASAPALRGGKGPKAMTYDEMKGALKSLAEDDATPEEQREAAKRALAAMDEAPEEKAEEPAEEEKHEESEEKAEEDEKPEAVAVVRLTARLRKLEAEAAARRQADETRERDSLLASLAGDDDETREAFAELPLASLRALAKKLPKATRKTSPVAAARAALGATPTQTSNAVAGAIGRTNVSGAGDELDVEMGLKRAAAPIEYRNHDNVLQLGLMTASEARAEMAKRKGAS